MWLSTLLTRILYLKTQNVHTILDKRWKRKSEREILRETEAEREGGGERMERERGKRQTETQTDRQIERAGRRE